MLLRKLATASFIAFLHSPIATAVPIAFHYSGTVHSITLFNGSTDTLGLSVGDAVSGSFFFDTSITDSDSAANRAFYEHSIDRMRFDGVQSTPVNYSYSYFLVYARIPLTTMSLPT